MYWPLVVIKPINLGWLIGPCITVIFICDMKYRICHVMGTSVRSQLYCCIISHLTSSSLCTVCCHLPSTLRFISLCLSWCLVYCPCSEWQAMRLWLTDTLNMNLVARRSGSDLTLEVSILLTLLSPLVSMQYYIYPVTNECWVSSLISWDDFKSLNDMVSCDSLYWV